MQPNVEMNDLVISAVNNMNGLFSQIKGGTRLSAISLNDANETTIILGSSSDDITLDAYTDHLIEAYSTSSSTSGSNSVESVYVKSTMTGAGGVGGRARFHTYTTVALGGWCNALKGYMEFGASGRTTGLASAIVAEMKLPSENLGSGGAYFPLEVEYVAAGNALVTAGGLSGNHAGFIWCQASGDDDGDFDDNGFFMHVKGLTAGAGHLLSATNQTLKCGLSGATTRYLFLSQIEDGISLGNSSTAQTHTAGTPLFQIYSTCSSGAAEPFYVKSTMTGTGGTGGRARFHLYTNSAQGGWANALKAFTEFGASGRITGLASAMCTDLELSAGTTQGTYTAFEANIIADAAVSTGTLTSFLRCNIAGTNSTGKTTLNTNAYLFDLGEGIVDTASGLIDSASITATNFSHRIRIKALGVDMWIGAHTDPDFTT